MITEPYRTRLAKCASAMDKAGLDAMVLTKPANMAYLTGDGRLCAYALVTRDGRTALGVPMTDVQDVEALASCDRIVGFEDEVGMIHSIAHDFEHFGLTEGVVGVEYTFLTQSMMAMVTHPHAKPEGISVKDCTAVMSGLRLVKEPAELERIAAAARVADAGMAAAVKAVKPGVTESQVAAEAEYAMRQAGAEGFYSTYVASGPRTSIAHGVPSLRKLGPGDLVMIDIHPTVNGYNADICRMVSVGLPTPEQQAAHDLYLRALLATIGKVRAAVDMMELEQTMHGILREAGHAGHIFGPPIHGVGLEFEEPPLPAGHAFFHGEAAPPPLVANIVIAIGNCGIYTGPWGVRVEDTVIVGEDGPAILTTYPQQLAIA